MMSNTSPHPGALTLQRLVAGETVATHLEAHVSSCGECQRRRQQVVEQQQAFEREVSFERFASGVERAARERWPAPRPAVLPWVGATVALAATLVFLVVDPGHRPAGPSSRLKGGAEVEIVVAEGSSGAQRATATAPGTPEVLGPGDRVRLGIVPAGWHFALALSIDARGEVTPVYSQGSQSLPLSGASPQFLPESLTFTGPGLERLVVVLSDRALELDVVAFQLRRRFAEAAGDLTRLEELDVPGEQFHRTFRKP
jgi:hypothetical protein